MKYDTILFDLDGTLLYTLEDLSDSINHMLAKYSLPTHSIEDVRRFVGNGLRKLVERSIAEGEAYPQFEDFFKEFVAYYNCHNLIKTKPYDTVIETTEKLNKLGIKMAIVTNKGQTASDSLINDFFAPHITVVIGDKSKVIYVGDSY